MKSVCLCFGVHQPIRLGRYRFFDIGAGHYYYDDYTNETAIRQIANSCYLPANLQLLSLLKKYKGKFRIAFSISGLAIRQFELYAPEVIDSFKALSETGCVEFLATTFSHSLASLASEEIFRQQVVEHQQLIEKTFGQKPRSFCNPELIYSDEIGKTLAEMGFKVILANGMNHVPDSVFPGHLYYNALNPGLKTIICNAPLHQELFAGFTNQSKGAAQIPATIFSETGNDEIAGLFVDYELFGSGKTKNSGSLHYLNQFLKTFVTQSDSSFATPSEIVANIRPFETLSTLPPRPTGELKEWLGNELQIEAFGKLYELWDQMKLVTDATLLTDWNYLQASDHFYYMNTSFFTKVHSVGIANPYDSPYDAFINYMNILSDFKVRRKIYLLNNSKF